MLYGAALCAGLLLTRLVMKEALVMMKESSSLHSDLEVRTSYLPPACPLSWQPVSHGVQTDVRRLAACGAVQHKEQRERLLLVGKGDIA
jgi:hypothetical protein